MCHDSFSGNGECLTWWRYFARGLRLCLQIQESPCCLKSLFAHNYLDFAELIWMGHTTLGYVIQLPFQSFSHNSIIWYDTLVMLLSILTFINESSSSDHPNRLQHFPPSTCEKLQNKVGYKNIFAAKWLEDASGPAFFDRWIFGSSARHHRGWWNLMIFVT